MLFVCFKQYPLELETKFPASLSFWGEDLMLYAVGVCVGVLWEKS